MMIGDRMDTDIVAGVDCGMMTTLVLSGVTMPKIIEQFPYRPARCWILSATWKYKKMLPD
jgi:NagD protein